MKRESRKKAQLDNGNHSIKTDTLAVGERFFNQFWDEANCAVDAVPNRADRETMTKKLNKAAALYRRAYTFGKDLSEATGRRIYFPEWKLHRLISENARDVWCRVDSRNLPSIPYPPEATKVLDRLRDKHGSDFVKNNEVTREG